MHFMGRVNVKFGEGGGQVKHTLEKLSMYEGGTDSEFLDKF